LMVVVGAFTQVQQALRWFVDNFNTIADWLATLRRVASFRFALVAIDKLDKEGGQIDYVSGSDGKITFENLHVVSPTGSAMLSDEHVEICRGEHVLIIGEPGVSRLRRFPTQNLRQPAIVSG
jgi:vitamin B12/bleomycin/antimicrobial peptide transport system ATP-binding/permease protein